jgi:proteasome lid subunit RPN8/RPN11
MRNEMIPLTVANTLDQSVKQRIEAPSQQTVKQAVQAAKMAPQGQFDVFDALGKVVSQQPVDTFRDQTIYVGVQRVAGGAPWFGRGGDDDDEVWDEGIDLDDLDKPIQKVVTMIRIGGDRQDIEPQGEETLIQLAERMGYGNKEEHPIEIRDSNGIDDVSNRRARDMVGCAFRVGLKAIPGGGFKRNNIKAHQPIVPVEIIEQTTAFTSNRGRLEMGGLLIGHVDEQGRNVVVAGFFPEQTEASSGYCEFEGGFAALAAGACDYANERTGGSHTPNLRVIGWIHTHPDIGIFLSGIDVRTFKTLRQMSGDGRCVAVVVDPLRKIHGVFRSPSSAENKDAEQATGKIRLSEDLAARYNKCLDRLRFLQFKGGKDRLPFIMPGVLRRGRIASGDYDDIEEARTDALYKTQRNLEEMKSAVSKKLVRVKDEARSEILAVERRIQASLKSNSQKMEDLKRNLSSQINQNKSDALENRKTINKLIKSFNAQGDARKVELAKRDDLIQNLDQRLSEFEALFKNGRAILIPKVEEVKPDPPEEVELQKEAPFVESDLLKAEASA